MCSIVTITGEIKIVIQLGVSGSWLWW